MGLYLCVFDGDEEIAGVEVGAYADFNRLRDYIVRELEGGKFGSRFPTLMVHSDCDGEWCAEQGTLLQNEITDIVKLLKERQPVPFTSDWQKAVSQSTGLVPQNAFESFIDVDGEFLLERLLQLVDVSIERQVPIIFQ